MNVTPCEIARRNAASVFSGAYPEAPRCAMANTEKRPPGAIGQKNWEKESAIPCRMLTLTVRSEGTYGRWWCANRNNLPNCTLHLIILNPCTGHSTENSRASWFLVCC